MRAKRGRIHEPSEQLVGADEAIKDADRVREAMNRGGAGREVVMRVPLGTLLAAIDSLEPGDLRQVAEHVERRLANGNQERKRG